MDAVAILEHDAVARVCAAHGVRRLRLFGSAVTDRFSPESSDMDFLVEFDPSVAHPFDAYFGLKEDLELLTRRPVDLVVSDAVRNPYFAAVVFDEAQVLYAA